MPGDRNTDQPHCNIRRGGDQLARVREGAGSGSGESTAGRIRTRDAQFRRLALYPLSYGGMMIFMLPLPRVRGKGIL